MDQQEKRASGQSDVNTPKQDDGMREAEIQVLGRRGEVCLLNEAGGRE